MWCVEENEETWILIQIAGRLAAFRRGQSAPQRNIHVLDCGAAVQAVAEG